MGEIVMALGLVFVLEGLAYAIAPRAMQHMMARMMELPAEQLRGVGVFAVAAGVILAWVARRLM